MFESRLVLIIGASVEVTNYFPVILRDLPRELNVLLLIKLVQEPNIDIIVVGPAPNLKVFAKTFHSPILQSLQLHDKFPIFVLRVQSLIFPIEWLTVSLDLVFEMRCRLFIGTCDTNVDLTCATADDPNTVLLAIRSFSLKLGSFCRFHQGVAYLIF